MAKVTDLVAVVNLMKGTGSVDSVNEVKMTDLVVVVNEVKTKG